MRKYRVQEEVPWKDVLHMLYWCLGTQVRHTRHQVERGDLRAARMLMPQLWKEQACVAALRRFLGYRDATKWEREAVELLERIQQTSGTTAGDGS